MTSCRNPTISLVAFEERGNPDFIFVSVPTERGRYVRTDRCVAYVPCSYCGSVVGEPCKSRGTRDRYGGGVHCDRKAAFRKVHGFGGKQGEGDVVFVPHFKLIGWRRRRRG